MKVCFWITINKIILKMKVHRKIVTNWWQQWNWSNMQQIVNRFLNWTQEIRTSQVPKFLASAIFLLFQRKMGVHLFILNESFSWAHPKFASKSLICLNLKLHVSKKIGFSYKKRNRKIRVPTHITLHLIDQIIPPTNII